MENNTQISINISLCKCLTCSLFCSLITRMIRYGVGNSRRWNIRHVGANANETDSLGLGLNTALMIRNSWFRLWTRTRKSKLTSCDEASRKSSPSHTGIVPS